MPGQPNDDRSVNRTKAEVAEPIPMVEALPMTLADDAANGGHLLNQPVGEGTRPPSKLRTSAVETSSG